MSDEKKSDEKKKRTVRRVVPVPTPDALGAAREKRLYEALLDNSRAIADAMATWDGESDLRVDIAVDTAFDGSLLAQHYRKAGWTGCLFVDAEAVGDRRYLIFPCTDIVKILSPSEGDIASDSPKRTPRKKK